MAIIARTGAWRDVWGSRSFGRFVLLCLGIWLHAADTLVTATLVPSIVREVGDVAYVAWTISLYQIGAVVAGVIAHVPLGCMGSRAAGSGRFFGSTTAL